MVVIVLSYLIDFVESSQMFLGKVHISWYPGFKSPSYLMCVADHEMLLSSRVVKVTIILTFWVIDSFKRFLISLFVCIKGFVKFKFLSTKKDNVLYFCSHVWLIASKTEQNVSFRKSAYFKWLIFLFLYHRGNVHIK